MSSSGKVRLSRLRRIERMREVERLDALRASGEANAAHARLDALALRLGEIGAGGGSEPLRLSGDEMQCRAAFAASLSKLAGDTALETRRAGERSAEARLKLGEVQHRRDVVADRAEALAATLRDDQAAQQSPGLARSLNRSAGRGANGRSRTAEGTGR